MEALSASHLDSTLKDLVKRGTPYLGNLRHGMQVLFEGSEESPGIKGFVELCPEK